MMNLAEAITINAKARPDHIAIIEGSRVLTYAQLDTHIRSQAGRLHAKGIRPGDLVGLCLGDTTEHIVNLYALAYMGAVILPMDVRWTNAERQRVSDHFQAKLVLVEQDSDRFGTVETVALDKLPKNGEEPVLRTGNEIPLLLSLSSGTTGRPKGPRITHYQMLRRFWTHWINLALNSNARYVSATPLYFGGGRTFAMSVLFAGGTLVLFPPPFQPDALCRELARVDATSVFLVPTQLRKLLELPRETLVPFGRLDLLICSGAPLDTAERVAIDNLCPNFVEYYASTEGGGVTLGTRQTRAKQPDSVGIPVFGVSVEVVGDDHIPLPPGQIGRLRYRGPGVATGYYNDEEAGEDAFRDGWFYPGDLAEIDASGHVSLRGRSKDMILRGGINIYPGDIETILREHDDVNEASVVGWKAGLMGEEIAAFVVGTRPLEQAELEAWCKERLAPYKVPRIFIQVEDLPRNSSGKVLKTQLAERLPVFPVA
ncbi:class I adenylate-forming enzyme family protein [Limoniibacter endophyticus]|uniref:Long-chain-fatty-acid--CoA ligase n=1 Tax=Limoniibacter endophyticus TaxID=1565040 RepID=A0A8J3DHI4_9HYPH|nr:class I adenylate-forming enzyme family protein [Limoniibacter endophyticus]GHC67496.1 long-chain-fatty-acid--CoA ligase [Limoniibacter endophyticus]